MHRESVFSDSIACFTWVALHEALLVDFANWNTVTVSNDASITDLLVDCGVVNKRCLLRLLLATSIIVVQEAASSVTSLVNIRFCTLIVWGAVITRTSHELFIHFLHILKV